MKVGWQFTLYEDKATTIIMRKLYSTITFSWNDAEKKTHYKQQRVHSGDVGEKFNIVRVGKTEQRYETVDKFDKVVNYSGEKVEVQF